MGRQRLSSLFAQFAGDIFGNHDEKSVGEKLGVPPESGDAKADKELDQLKRDADASRDARFGRIRW